MRLSLDICFVVCCGFWTVFASAHAQVPARPETSPAAVPEDELARSWRTLQEGLQAARKPPLERIAAVDQWRREQRSQIAALTSHRPSAPPAAAALPDAALDPLAAAIERELAPLRDARLPALERIRQTEGALEKVSSLLTGRRLDRESSRLLEVARRAALEAAAGPEGAGRTWPAGRKAKPSPEASKPLSTPERGAAGAARMGGPEARPRRVIPQAASHPVPPPPASTDPAHPANP